MWNRGGFRSAALERARAQLSGQRVTRSDPPKAKEGRDEVGANFGKPRQILAQGLGDLSSEGAESEHQDHSADLHLGGGSRFLKKSAGSAAADGPADEHHFKLIPQRSSQSVALSRLALIEDRLRKKSKNLGPEVFPQESVLSAQSSSDLSMTGSRFLKKKWPRSVDQKDYDRKSLGGSKTPQHMTSPIGKSTDSDEEDVRRLLGKSLDSPDESLIKVLRQSSERAAKTNIKSRVKESVMSSEEKQKEKPTVSSAFMAHHLLSPSPSPPSSRKAFSASRSSSRRAVVTSLSLHSASGHSEIRSLEELFPVASNDIDTLSERSVASDDFKLNFMTLDDLAPVTFGTDESSKEKPEVSPTGYRARSPFPADKISHHGQSEEAPVEYESDFESEIQTETAGSANEISEHFSGGEKLSSVATESPSHTDDSHTEDDYTVSEDPSKSTNVSHNKSEFSFSRSRSDSSSYSSDATVTQSETKIPAVRRSLKDATVQTQRDGLSYAWSTGQAVLGPSVGMSYVDPTPVASHVISAEAVEALTSYSPAVFALNDMLRQQLALTRSFIESSRHLHQTMVESLGPADYRYTTLEETKEFIRCNRSPKLSMEDALEEVLREMREYHYI